MENHIKLTIDDIGTQGDGIAHDGKDIYYIPYVLKGDEIWAKSVKSSRNGHFAKAVSFISRKNEPAQPICDHYTFCGGCKLQHMKQADYEAFKKNQLKIILDRMGVHSPELDEARFLGIQSRRRVTFHLNHDYQLSFYSYHDHQSIGIKNCPLLTEKLQKTQEKLQKWLNSYGSTIGSKIKIYLCIYDWVDMLIISELPIPPKASPALNKLQDISSIGRLSWMHPSGEPQIIWQREITEKDELPARPTLFAQASQEGEAFLQRKLGEYMGSHKEAVDLFCGNGLFSFFLAEKKVKLQAFDSSVSALESAKIRLKNYPHLRGRLSFIERDLFRQPLLPQELKEKLIVLDPPRAGAMEVIHQIRRSKVQDIVMISCNPMSFARDMAKLQQSGFTIDQMALLDQFTYSPHMELIAKIKRI